MSLRAAATRGLASLRSPSVRLAAQTTVSLAFRSHSLLPARPPRTSPLLSHFSRFQSTDSKAAAPPPPRARAQEEPPKIYTYEDIKQLVTNPDPNKIIVDVREPAEFQQGAIPGAVNIPYKSTPGALDLSPEEFEDVFKFPKPDKEKELVFYCLAGVRSTAAADLAQIFGYNKLGNYVGSWEDWVAHEQPAAESTAEPSAETTEK